ncbi:Membrane protein implicated in regulation of membrane protease activity [Micromonospora pallida]|uniref:Membrane protein implicated in regulation of membrane protease activity n=1 Tax=Micromonospora pallida TaxID=145854 RepID=A0A1C6RQP4_9ACTN|nr:NfeD family protein [Micromonospora pallida]SCL19540.1 Membrane protein implicated in regulation of membrane protease activity [Micromonospora pallida]
MDAVLWIVLGVVLAVAEIFTTTLFLIMFGVGAFAAAGAAALGAPVGVQAIVFAAVSALTVLAARPTIQRHRRSAVESGEQPFGVEALEGASALVLERVDTDGGLVKIDGELWSARSYDAAQVFAPGQRVQVIQVRGATALVWRDDISPGTLPGSEG